ncbi:MAG: mechanosensitive ion channel family protein [Dehalococcoidia bacterium]|nr:MAG: mechanosensitive ion channel family protein [Dehalococcoidia bacterium]
MVNMIDWIENNWLLLAVPGSIFLAFCIVGLWVRRVLYNRLDRLLTKTGWGGREVLVQTTRGPFFFWFMLLGAFVAIKFSSMSNEAQILSGKIIGSILIISIIWLLIILINRLFNLLIDEIKSPKPPGSFITNGVRVTILLLGVLILADYWGWPLTPVILLLAAAIFIAVVASRDTILNIFSGFEIAAARNVKEGDFIKLSSGEEGYVTDMTWRTIKIKTPGQDIIIVPNSKLVRETVINYGRPLKRAPKPFHFYTRLHLKELTGLKARNLAELVNVLKSAPDSVIYYHTHHFLEEHQFLTPEPSNDFALWVDDSLDEHVLSEKLANIDTFAYFSLDALQSKIVTVIEQYMADNPASRLVKGENDFHFLKSNSVVVPTPYLASDLREFVEVLRKITIDSLYYHIFESRLRLQKRSNDFSVWIRDSFGEHDLADKIDNLVPYTSTIEAMRSFIIQNIEKRIK